MKSARVLLLPLLLIGCTSDPAATTTPSPDGGGVPADGGATTETCAPITGAGTTHDKDIEANETWTAAGSPHIVTAPLDVVNGATLTIEPCAEVRMAKDTSIDVASPSESTGTLKAEGTAQKPIKIVSNVAGERWRQLFVRVPGGKATLRHVTLEGGGADLETMHATLFVRGPGEWPSRRDVLVDHVTIKGSFGYGAVVDRAAAFAEGSTDLVIEGAGMGDARYQFPLFVGEAAIHTLPSGKYTGNAIDEIHIIEDSVLPGAGLREDATMRDLGVPYRVGGGTSSVLAVERSPITNAVSTLTIEAGVHIRFLPRSFVNVHHQNADEEAGGALVANGTAEKPIVLTSASPTPQKGDWGGIWFGGRPLGTNKLDHVKIEYAGGDCLCGLATCNDLVDHDAAVLMHYAPSPGFAITNTTISESAGHGIHRGWQGTSTQSFLATNTFIGITGCQETIPVPENGTCAEPKPACP
jgi:hypothetical protein